MAITKSTKKVELNGGESNVESAPVSTIGNPEFARPLASETVAVATPEGVVQTPEQPLYLRYELWRDTAFVRRPVRDEDGAAEVFIDAEVALAALENTRPYNEEDSIPAVHYLRAVYATNPDGSTAGCHYWTRPVYTPDTEDPNVIHCYQSRSEKAAMAALKTKRDRNKEHQIRSQKAFAAAAGSLNGFRTAQEAAAKAAAPETDPENK